jgi:hypothetical protein
MPKLFCAGGEGCDIERVGNGDVLFFCVWPDKTSLAAPTEV